jgi:hypothetical protein
MGIDGIGSHCPVIPLGDPGAVDFVLLNVVFVGLGSSVKYLQVVVRQRD